METVSDVLIWLDRWLYEKTGEHLSDLQRILIQESWQGKRKTYGQIASEYNYSTGYIQQVVGPKLWRLLSRATGQKVTKTNVRSVLEICIHDAIAASHTALSTSTPCPLESPGDSVPLDSRLYIQRPPYEPQCYDEVLKPGALIRIKAARQMGKTSLMKRLLVQAEEAGYRTVYLNFQQVERDRLNDLNLLLRWCCANIARQLSLAPQLDTYWDADVGSKMSCTLYLEGHVLENIDCPIVLALEEVGELLENLPVAQDFLTMLRAWHENGKSDAQWKKLRLIMVQSTEMYVPLNINQSPFNVGFGINLVAFNQEQVSELVRRHSLQLEPPQIEQLRQLVGGHPYLVRLLLYHLVFTQENFEIVLSKATTDEGIYRDHLHRHLWMMQKFPELSASFQQVLSASEPVKIEQIHSFKLQSLGLITLDRNRAQVSCQLYQHYFGASPGNLRPLSNAP